MALTLFDILVDVYQDLGVLNISSATGASSKISVLDSKSDGLYEDDEFNNGFMFVLRTSDGLAPQGEYQRITDFAGTTATFTVDSFSADIDSGDTIGFTNNEYPLETLRERLNTALRSEKIGDIVAVDTSLTTVAGQTEYTLPVALKRKPFKVQIQTSTTSGDYEYQTVYGWTYIPAAAGSTGKLVLSSDPTASMILRVWYVGRHAVLSTYSSVIDETIPPEVVRYVLLTEVMNWQNARERGENDYIKEEWNKYSGLLDEALARWDRPLQKRRSEGIVLPDLTVDSSSYDSTAL